VQKPYRIIAFSLMAAGLGVIVSFDSAYKAKEGFSPILAYPRVWISEFRSPHLAYPRFQTLIANKETAKSAIESVNLVESNCESKYLSVKLKNDPSEYRVYKPENCIDDPCKRLESYGIPVGISFSCL
jgi:hypothetical protein